MDAKQLIDDYEIRRSNAFVEAKRRLTKGYIKDLKKTTPKISSFKTDHLTSKMWITPDHKVVPLSSWHYRYILDNPKIQQKWGLKGLPEDEQKVRLAALRVGFTRVNYEQRQGILTIEACSKFWTGKLKDTIFMLIADNLDSLYKIQINLLNDRGVAIKSGYSELFRYNDAEKLEHIPMISESIEGLTLREFLKG